MSNFSDKFKALYNDHHFQLYRRFPVIFIKGEGTKVYDDEGRVYIDALAGIAVNNVGHCHPKVVSAIKEQAEKLIHISNLYYNVPQSVLAQLLTEISGMDRVFFCNSGLEANEGAIKIARKYGEINGRKGPIISFTNCFHGRSIASITMGQEKYQKGFGPLPEGFIQLSYNSLESLDKIPENSKAVFVECIQGEGGVIPAKKEFLQKLAEICKSKGILLVVDEIQTGMGRTGKMFSFEHYDIKPDIITIAKALGGGVPIGAVLAKETVAQVISAGDHGTTFGGNPLACAAALAATKAILEEHMLEKAQDSGAYFLKKLQEFAQGNDAVKEVRGKGLMIGVEFNFPCQELAQKMLELGVLVSCSANTTIRFVPPLIISKNEIDEIVKILESALNSVKTLIQR